MIRWLLSILGVIIIVLGFLIGKKHPPLPDEPQCTTVEQARLLLEGDQRHYVSMDAVPDPGLKIYATATRKPLYTLRPTDRIYDLSKEVVANPTGLASHVGAVVRLSGASSIKNSVSLQVISTDKKKKEDRILQERLLVPLQNTGNRIWALSKVFKKSERSETDRWLSQPSFEGALSYIGDIGANAPQPPLDHSWKEIRSFIAKEFGIKLDDHDFVILTDAQWNFKPHYLSPLEGSDDRLFVILNAGMHEALGPVITGILQPSPLAWYDEFPSLLKKTLPNRIGILSLEKSADYNRRFKESARRTKTTGYVLVGLSMIGHLRKMFRKKHSR